MTQGGRPARVAILGGGMGALGAAFELTSEPDWRERYEITVYQQGFRLGGKGASGRNAKHGQRIEEHGLHIWMGWYDNAFRVMRRCYEELGRPADAPLATLESAFKPHDYVVLEESLGAEWRGWPLDFPRNEDKPGEGGPLPSPWDTVVITLGWMKKWFEASPYAGPTSGAHGVLGRLTESLPALRRAVSSVLFPPGGPARPGGRLHRLRTMLASGVASATELLELSAAPFEAGFAHLAHAIAEGLPHAGRDAHRDEHDEIVWLLDHFVRYLARRMESDLAHDDDARRAFILLDLAAANLRGMIRDGLVFHPWDFTSIDDEDYVGWLKRHGAATITQTCAPVRALYQLAFAVDHGFAAGTALTGVLRMLLTYRGAIFWKMQAGMGDTVFTPLYEVLRRRGVRFEFFHRVEKLRCAPDGRSVSSIEITRQATVKHSASYQPLVDVQGLACWPSEPLYEQLVEGEELERSAVDLESFWTDWKGVGEVRLTRGRDFDYVVLGLSVAAHKTVCSELMERDARYRAMVEHVGTTGTQAMQLWFDPPLKGLGWDGPSPIFGAYAEPFDTWADMTHLLPRESWPAGRAPQSLAYLCSPLPDDGVAPPAPDPAYPRRELARVVGNVHDWLGARVRPLWPAATRPGAPDALDFAALHDPEDRAGQARLNAQYVRANVNPTDRYVLSVPGTTRYRLRANESGFDNVVLAGDWVRTGLSAGCVEAATMGGLDAGKALAEWVRARPLSPTPSEEHKLPAYVERGGDLVLRQPYGLTGATLHSFFLAARYDALSALCERYLNAPARGAVRYVPLAPMTLLVAADIREIRSLDPLDRDKGVTPERDVAFWVPLLAGRGQGSAFRPERLAWFIPYIFVNSGPATAAGREVYGFPKEVSKIAMPTAGEMGGLSVQTTVLPRYAPTEFAVEREVLSVRRTGSSLFGEIARAWDGAESALAAVGAQVAATLRDGHAASLLPSWDLVRNLVDALVHGEVPLAFLKQFRDASDPSRACYQAVVEAPATLTAFHSGGILAGEYEVHVADFASHPMIADLGLAGPVLRPALAAHLAFDFVQEKGRVVSG